MFRYYRIYQGILDMQAKKHMLIREVISKTYNKDIDKDAKVFMASAVAHKMYPNNPGEVVSFIKELNIAQQVCEANPSHSASQIGQILSKLEGDQFDAFMNLAVSMAKYCTYRTVIITMISLYNGEKERITGKLVDSLNYEKSVRKQLMALIPDFKITCDVCGRQFSLKDSKFGITSCNECRQSLKAKLNKKVVYKSAAGHMAYNSVVSDLRAEKIM